MLSNGDANAKAPTTKATKTVKRQEEEKKDKENDWTG